MSNILDLINAIDGGKTLEMESAFTEIMAAKMVDAIEAKRQEVANNLFADAVEETGAE